MKTIMLILIIFCALIQSYADADIIYLKNGGKIEGKIVNKTEKGMQIKVPYGEVFINSLDVVRIEEKPIKIEEARQGETKIGRFKKSFINFLKSKLSKKTSYFNNTFQYKTPKDWIIVRKENSKIEFSPKNAIQINNASFKFNTVGIILYKPEGSATTLKTAVEKYKRSNSNTILKEKVITINGMSGYDTESINKENKVKQILRTIVIENNGKICHISFKCQNVCMHRNKSLYDRYCKDFEKSLESITF